MKKLIILLLSLILLQSLFAYEVQMGSGTNHYVNSNHYFPISVESNYSYSQSIYLSQDFWNTPTSQEKIYRISFNYGVFRNITNADNWTVYLGTINSNTFSDWKPLSELTEVFSGDVGLSKIVSNSQGWLEITLDTPFHYNPSTDGNLVVAVIDNSAGTNENDDLYSDFFSTDFGGNTVYSISSDVIDPNNPPNRMFSQYTPNIKFSFSDLDQYPLKFDSSEYVFKSTFTGLTETKTITIKNFSNYSQTINDISLHSTPDNNTNNFSLSDLPAFPVSIPSMGSISFQLNMSPVDSGNLTTKISLSSPADSYMVDVSGVGVQTQTAPFFDDMENGLANWKKSDDRYVRITGDDQYSGTNSAEYYREFTAGYCVTGLTLQFNAIAHPMIEFWYNIGNNSNLNNLILDVKRPGSDSWDYGVWSMNGTGTTWLHASVDLDGYDLETGVFQLKLRGLRYSGADHPILLDDVHVYNFTGPPDPTALQTPTDNELNVFENRSLWWQTNEHHTEGYKLYFGTDNPPTNIENGTDMFNQISYNPSSRLNYSTQYFWKVVPYNSYGGDAVNCPVWTFTTRDDPTISTFPWTEEFTTWPPENWDMINGETTWHQYNWESYPITHCAQERDWFSAQSFIDTPPFDLTSLSNPKLSFDWSHLYNSYYDDAFIKVSVSTDLGYNWTEIYTITGTEFNTADAQYNAPSSNYSHTTNIDLSSFIGQDVRIRFEAKSQGGPAIFLDNVHIENVELPPHLSISQNTMDYGTVETNYAVSQDLVLTNDGGGVVTIAEGNLLFTGDPDSEYSYETPTYPIVLNANQSYTLPIVFSPKSDGTKTGTLHIIADSNTEQVALTGIAWTNSNDYVQIGTQNNINQHLPEEPYYRYSYTQTIYKQTDINQSGKYITSISYYYSGNSHLNDNIEIYMAHTSQNSLNDWMPISNFTQVYDGTMDVLPGNHWTEIQLTTPFQYNNVDNLIIAFHEKKYGGYTAEDDFYCTHLDQTPISMIFYSDAENPDLDNPPTATNSVYFPNIRMKLEDLPPEITLTPDTYNFDTVPVGLTVSTQFTVSNVGGGTYTINSGDIAIDGNNPTQFTLGNITYPIILGAGESYSFDVNFMANAISFFSADLNLTLISAKTKKVEVITSTLYGTGSAHVGDTTINPINVSFTNNHYSNTTDNSLFYNAYDLPGTDDNDIVYKLVLSQTKYYNFSTEGSNFDTKLAIYKDSTNVANWVPKDDNYLYYNDDFSTSTYSKLENVVLYPGTYFAIVDGNNAHGSAVLNIDRIVHENNNWGNFDFPVIVDLPDINNPGGGIIHLGGAIDPLGDVGIIVQLFGSDMPFHNVPNPEFVAISYNMDIQGDINGVQLHCEFSYLGMNPIPNEILFWNGSGWAVPQNVQWETPEAGKVSFDITLNGRDGGTEVVLNNGENSTLPVELSSFEATLNSEDSQVNISWQTQSETDFLGFNILRANSANISEAVKINPILIAGENSSNGSNYSYSDKDIESDTEYNYWLEIINFDNTKEIFGPRKIKIHNNDDIPNVPKISFMKRPYPNPFNPITNINFGISEAGNVDLSIYNIKGQIVKNLINGKIKSGYYHKIWNGRDENNKKCASGIYFIKLKTDNFVEINKVMMLK